MVLIKGFTTITAASINLVTYDDNDDVDDDDDDAKYYTRSVLV